MASSGEDVFWWKGVHGDGFEPSGSCIECLDRELQVWHAAVTAMLQRISSGAEGQGSGSPSLSQDNLEQYSSCIVQSLQEERWCALFSSHIPRLGESLYRALKEKQSPAASSTTPDHLVADHPNPLLLTFSPQLILLCLSVSCRCMARWISDLTARLGYDEGTLLAQMLLDTCVLGLIGYVAKEDAQSLVRFAKECPSLDIGEEDGTASLHALLSELDDSSGDVSALDVPPKDAPSAEDYLPPNGHHHCLILSRARLLGKRVGVLFAVRAELEYCLSRANEMNKQAKTKKQSLNEEVVDERNEEDENNDNNSGPLAFPRSLTSVVLAGFPQIWATCWSPVVPAMPTPISGTAPILKEVSQGVVQHHLLASLRLFPRIASSNNEMNESCNAALEPQRKTNIVGAVRRASALLSHIQSGLQAASSPQQEKGDEVEENVLEVVARHYLPCQFSAMDVASALGWWIRRVGVVMRHFLPFAASGYPEVNQLLSPLRSKAIMLAKVLRQHAGAVPALTSMILLPYYWMISALLHAKPAAKITSALAACDSGEGDLVERGDIFSFDRRLLEDLIGSPQKNDTSELSFKKRCEEVAVKLLQERFAAFEEKCNSLFNSTKPIESSPSSGNSLIPLAVSLVIHPGLVMERLLHLTRRSRSTSESLDTLSLEDEIQIAQRPTIVVSDRRLKSVQRSMAYTADPSPSLEGRADNLLQHEYTAATFYPRYAVLFSTIQEALEQLIEWMASSPYRFLSLQIINDGVLNGTMKLENTSEKYKSIFSSFALNFFSMSLQIISLQVIQHRSYRSRSSDSSDPALAVAGTELLMFYALVSRKETTQLPCASNDSNDDCFSFVRRAIAPWFSALPFVSLTSSPTSPALSVSATLTSQRHFLRFLLHRIVNDRTYGLAAFFLPTLRAIGVDDSIATSYDELMLIAHAKCPSTPLSAEMAPPNPLFLMRMGAELVGACELPLAGYCSSGKAPLISTLKDDALEWWEENLFQYFTSNDAMTSLIAALVSSMARSGQKRERGNASEPGGKMLRKEGEQPVNEEANVKDREATPIPTAAAEVSSHSPSCLCLLSILVEAGVVTIQRLLSRGPFPPPVVEMARSRKARMLELETLKIFFLGWWRLCDEMVFLTEDAEAIISKNDSSALARCRAAHLRRQRAKHAVVCAISKEFGVVLSSSLPEGLSGSTAEDASNATAAPGNFGVQSLPLLKFLYNLLEDNGTKKASPEHTSTTSSTSFSSPPGGWEWINWMTRLEYENVEYSKLDAIPNEIPSRGTGPQSLLRAINMEFRKSLDTVALVQRRKLFIDYAAWKKGTEREEEVSAMIAALEKDRQFLFSDVDLQADETESSDHRRDARQSRVTSYLSQLIKAVRFRSALSAAHAAGAAAAFRQLLLHVTFASSSDAWLSPTVLVEYTGKLAFSLCKLLSPEAGSGSGSAKSSSPSGNSTLNEVTSIAIILRILLDTLEEAQNRLASSKESGEAKQRADLVDSFARTQKHFIQDITSSMKNLLSLALSRADATVLLLAQHFKHRFQQHSGYATVVKDARTRLGQLRGDHHAPALKKLLELSADVPTAAETIATTQSPKEEDKADEEHRRHDRQSKKSRGGRRHRSSRGENDKGSETKQTDVGAPQEKNRQCGTSPSNEKGSGKEGSAFQESRRRSERSSYRSSRDRADRSHRNRHR